jgi:hypothetical protein
MAIACFVERAPCLPSRALRRARGERFSFGMGSPSVKKFSIDIAEREQVMNLPLPVLQRGG